MILDIEDGQIKRTTPILKDKLAEAYREGYHDRETTGQQSERDKVLDELIRWVQLGNYELDTAYPNDRLMKKLKELRSKGEHDPE